MKRIQMEGRDIKCDNGSGSSLAAEFPKRRFHNATLYCVAYHGNSLDRSTVRTIARARVPSRSKGLK